MRESDALEGVAAPDILSIIAGGMEKVRPRSGREAGLGHAGSDARKGWTYSRSRTSCAPRHSDFLSIGRSSTSLCSATLGLPVHRSLQHFPVLRGTRTSCPSVAPALPCAPRHSDFLSIGRPSTSLCSATLGLPVHRRGARQFLQPGLWQLCRMGKNVIVILHRRMTAEAFL